MIDLKSKLVKNYKYFIVFFIFLNLIILNFEVFKNNFIENRSKTETGSIKSIEITSYPRKIENNENKVEKIVEETKLEATNSGISCSGDCLAQIKEATESVNNLQSQIEKINININNIIASQQSTSTTQQVSSGPGVKEFFISFGSGSNGTDDWADLSGIQAYIDSSQYSQIKSVVFEASVRIPTGNEIAYVRLFNVTDKHPVWFSDVSLEGGTPKLLFSKPITLDTGNKLYQVQMKTSLKYTAILDQARLHITTY